MPLDPEKRAKLIEILKLLGSERPDERAAAGAVVDRFLKKEGLPWEELITRPRKNRTSPRSSDTPWRPSKLKKGQRGSWRRYFGMLLTVRRLGPGVWSSACDGLSVLNQSQYQFEFFPTEATARAAAEQVAEAAAEATRGEDS